VKFDTTSRRFLVDQTMVALCWTAVVLAAIPLVAVLIYVTSQGIHRFDLNFFTHVPAPVGDATGGMANSLVGTIELVLIASAVGIPVGILAGIYLAEFGKSGKFAWAVRFTADVLSGVPSIVTGIAAYTLIVRPMHHFSAWAGGVALGTMMIPMITRTTEELVKMVPRSVRESALALGIPEWKTILGVVVTTARNGILMGVLLSLSRIAGETAPLLFTAFNNNFWSTSPNQPTASLTVQIFTYAISPFDDWHDQAWTGALTLLLLVVGVNLLARIFVKRTGRAVG